MISWLLNKLRESESRKTSRFISQHLTPEKIARLESIVGTSIKDKSYYLQALMHRSFLENHHEYDNSNERLEFLGDAVLNLSVAEFLFDEFPDKDEGFLTKVRSKLVNRLALAESARSIELSSFILISKNLSDSAGGKSKTVLSDALEALIGAIYLDSGLKPAKDFIFKVLIKPNMKEGEYLIDENFKSQLLEYAQANKYAIPVYSVIKEEGPQHNRTFTIEVKVGDVISGTGTGKNKKTAEQNAAKDALNKVST